MSPITSADESESSLDSSSEDKESVFYSPESVFYSPTVTLELAKNIELLVQMNALKVLTLAACMGTAGQHASVNPSRQQLFLAIIHDNFEMKLTEKLEKITNQC